MVLVLGVGVQFTTGVANGLTGVQGAIGTAVPGVMLICVATVSPLALFKLLSFVDPATTSGAVAARRPGRRRRPPRPPRRQRGGQRWVESGGRHRRRRAAAPARTAPRDATTSRFNTAVAGGLSQLGPGRASSPPTGLGLIAGLGAAGAAIGADVTNQMGVGHNTYPPDFSPAGRRASSRQPAVRRPRRPQHGGTRRRHRRTRRRPPDAARTPAPARSAPTPRRSGTFTTSSPPARPARRHGRLGRQPAAVRRLRGRRRPVRSAPSDAAVLLV